MAIDLTNLPDDNVESEPAQPSIAPGDRDALTKPKVVDLSKLPDTSAAQLATTFKQQASRPHPDDQVRIDEMVKRTGWPEPVVRRNPAEAQRRATEPDWHALESAAPRTANTLAKDVKLFHLAQDDVETLAEIEKKAWSAMSLDEQKAMTRRWAQNVQDVYQASADPQKALDMIRSVPAGVVDTAAGGFFGGTADLYDAAIRKISGFLGYLGIDPTAMNFEGSEYLSPSYALRQAEGGGQAIAEFMRPPAERQALHTQVMEGIGQLGLQAGLFKGNPQGGLAFFMSQGADQAQDRAEAFGATPEQQDAAMVAGALATGLAERTGIDILLNRVPPAIRNEFMRTSVDVLLAGGIEAAEEWFERILNNAIAQQVYNPDQEILEAPDNEEAAAGISAGIVRFFLQSITGSRAPVRVQQSQQTTATLLDIGEAAAASKLAQRSPEAFAQYLQDTLAEGPVEDVYINAQVFAEYFQAQGVDPVGIAEQLPSVKAQLEEAMTTGGDLRIPLVEYVSKLAGTEHNMELAQHARFRPEDMSLAEATLWQEQAGEQFQQEAEQILNQREADQAFQQSASNVYENIFGQLQTAGRFTDDVNKAYATLVRDFYAVQGNKLGLTPEEMFQRYPLRIQSEGVTGDLQFDQNGQVITDSPAFRDWFGESKVVNEKGEPLVVYHGTYKDFSKFEMYKTETASSFAGLEGFFFTPNSEYASDMVGGEKPRQHFNKANPRVLPVYLSLKNPKVVTLTMRQHSDPRVEAPIIRQARAEGHDGVVFTTKENEDEGGITHYVAFHPEQIKSVFNRGTFDKTDPRILYQDGIESTFGIDVQDITDDAQAQQIINEYRRRVSSAGRGTDASGTRVSADYDAYAAVGGGRPASGWAGATRVRGTDGQPYPVHRGAQTPLKITSFSPDRLGGASGNPSSGLGVWLTPDFYEAKSYGKPETFYLDLRKPKTIKVEKLPAFDSVQDAHAFREDLRAQGYDGIAIDARHLGGPIHFVAFNPEQVITLPKTDEFYQFAGEKAETADKYALTSAQERIAAGEDKERVRQDTGWFQGADGKWRYEIDDSGARSLRTKPENGLSTVGELLDHKGLFAAYPDLRNLSVNLLMEGEGGRYHPDEDYIALKGVVSNKRGEVFLSAQQRSSLFHELQHAIQKREGFARGGSPLDASLPTNNELARKINERYSKAKLEVQHSDEYRDFVNSWMDKWPEDTWPISRRTGEPSKELLRRQAEALADLELGVDALEDARKAEVDKFFASGGANFLNERYEGYRRLAGEVEARNTQTRIGLNEQQRREASPDSTADVPAEDIIVVFRGKEMENALPPANLYDQQKRGAITFGQDITADPSTITLLQNADLSTFLHESGHFFLEVASHMARQGEVTMGADLQKVLDWFGVESLEKWQSLTLEEKRPHHEQFARGFEAYLFEGKAPNLELQSLFSRFRSWLINVYRSLRGLNVELTDEVRGVFDRMLASEVQIQAAETARAYKPLFESAEQAGMTADEWSQYQTLGADATSEAIDDLQHRSLRDMRWLSNAKSRAMKALQKEADGKRKAIRAEVTDEVRQRPIYKAMRFLKRGEVTGPDGNMQSETLHRLDINALKEMYPSDEQSPGWQALGYGKYGMLGDKGLHPDLVADMFGFTSGDELVKALLRAEPQKELIEGLTDQRMLERHGDLVDPDTIERAAEAAIHNNARTRFVTTELNALSRATGQRPVLVRAAKAYAETAMERKKVRDLKPYQYTVAEARAAREAEKALRTGDVDQAAIHKRAQLLNGYFFKAADSAVSEIDKAVDYFKKFSREGTRKKLDTDYLDQIDTLLNRFDLRKGITLKALDERKTLAAWVEAQQKQGFEPVIDERLLDEARRQHYRDMTVEELRGLRDTIKNIEHLARLKKKLLTAKDQRELETALDDAVNVIEANAKGRKHTDIETRLPQDEAARLAGSYLASHRKLASLLRQMDGYTDGGTLWELFMRPLNEKSDLEAVEREKATQRLGQLFGVYSSKDMARMYRKEYVPEIGRSITRMGRLMVALNWGNEQNRQRIQDGYSWTPRQVEAVLATLDKRDWDFVQGTWDYINEYWPQIAEKEKRVTGLVPEKVEAVPVLTPFGEYKGGYFPIKYDDRQSPRAYADAAKEAAEQALKGKYSRATTRRGHTKTRAEQVQRPVRLDFGVLFEHVDQVIHDLAFHEYLIDANRLLGSKRLQDAVIEHYGHEVYKQLQNAITDVAAGDVPAQTAFEKGINWLRAGTSIAAMGWNMGTALLQPLGLSQSVVRIGPKWVAKGISRFLRDAASMENTTKWIFERSNFMRLRAKTMQREINEIRNKVTDQSVRRKLLGPVEDSYFWLITRAQLIADVPTWLGQYEKAMAQGETEARAIALADQAVLDSQGGGQVKDLAGIQRGGPLMRLWTNFYSYFNVTYNLTAESVKRTKFKSPLSVAHLAGDMFMLYTVPAVLGWMMREALIRGECERGTDIECVAGQLAREQAGYIAGTMVGVREVSGVLQGFYGYEGPAGTRFFSEFGKTIQQAAQGELDKAALRALNQTAGILFHYPAGQVQRTVEGIAAMAEGETVNPLAPMFGPPRN